MECSLGSGRVTKNNVEETTDKLHPVKQQKQPNEHALKCAKEMCTALKATGLLSCL